MIFYSAETKSEALRLALQDERWSEDEKKALAEILNYIKVEEENVHTMTTEEWINNPVDLSHKYPKHVVRGKWTNGQTTYTTAGQKYMFEPTGTGYRVGKCYPEPDELGKS